jgi:hypothetical protein
MGYCECGSAPSVSRKQGTAWVCEWLLASQGRYKLITELCDSY